MGEARLGGSDSMALVKWVLFIFVCMCVRLVSKLVYVNTGTRA